MAQKKQISETKHNREKWGGGSARTTADRKIIRGGEENLLNMT